MITGAVKNKVDQIWTNIWAGGITNPLTVIEQLTYLMFIRSLDVNEIKNEKMENLMGMPVDHIFQKSPVGQAMRWSHFKDKNPDEIFHIVSTFVFPAIKAMKYGHLPDFDSNGKLIPVPDMPGKKEENETAFAKYMADAAFLIPTPQMLSRLLRAWKISTPMTWKIRTCRGICTNTCWESCRPPEGTASSARRSISGT